jgi:DNA adenine methylase
VLQIAGSKVRLAGQVINLIGGTHHSYVEPYLGSAAVLLAKPPVRIEVANDLDHELINFYKVLRARETRYDLIDALVETPYARWELEEAKGEHDPAGYIPDGVERARRFMIRANQTYVGGVRRDMGGAWVATFSPAAHHSNATKWNNYRTRLSQISRRLQNVQIDCVDGLKILDRVITDPDAEGIAVYLDPPYPAGTRAGSNYRQDMTDDQHLEMLARAIVLRGPTVISTYPTDMYKSVLDEAGWSCIELKVAANSSAGKGSRARRTEVLWANSACASLTTVPESDGLFTLFAEDGILPTA